MPFNKYLKLLVIFLFPMQLFAQDITGVWKGEFYVDSTKKTYPFELSISENNGKLTGYSRISFEENGTTQVVFRNHSITQDGDNYIIEDDKQLAQASSIMQPREVRKTMIVALTIQDSMMILKGEWSTNKTKHFLAARGTVQVQRKNDFRKTEIFKKLDELNLTSDLSFNTIILSPNSKTQQKILPALLAKETLKIKSKKINTTAIPLPIIAAATPAVKPKATLVVKPIVKPEPIAMVKQTPPKPQTTIAKVTKPQPRVTKVEKANVIPTPAEPTKSAPVVIHKPIQSVALVTKNAAIEVNKRTNSSIQSLYYNTDSLQLTLYDNGEVDGDTVSVLLDGKIIIAKQRLDVKPNVHTIYFDKDTPDSMMLVMYAENLGSIPPNTGLLVVHDGKAIYEVRFSADLLSNAAIILRRKKEQ